MIKKRSKVEKFKSGEVGIDDFRKILSGIDRSTYRGAIVTGKQIGRASCRERV